MNNVSSDASGLYFLTARNNQTEEKYPIILKIRPSFDLTAVTECALEEGLVFPKKQFFNQNSKACPQN